MNRSKFLRVLLTSSSLFFLLFTSPFMTVTQAEEVYTTVYVDPSPAITSPGETFSVDIAISNVTELSGYSIALLYDSTILNGSSITEGPFLGGGTFFYIANFTDNVNATHGVAYFVSILYISPPGVSGDGVLASVSFKAKTSGDTTLRFWREYTSLTNSSIIKIPFETSDGTVHVIPPDVAITSIALSQSAVLQGETVQVNVTATNQGGRTETFDVTTYYSTETVGTQTVTNLTAGASKTLTFNWNTAGVPPGVHTIKAEASTVPDEIDIADNVLVDGTVKVMKPPTAVFTYSPPSPRAGETITFNASDSTPDGGTIVSYDWDFGDGNTTATSNPIITHAYSLEGTYNVTLTITDSDDLTDSTWQLVGVGVALYHDVAIVNVTNSHSKAYVGQIINITVTAENQGDYVETFNITAYYNGHVVDEQTVLDLNPSANTTLTFSWDTTEVTPCQNYTIRAEAEIIPGETEIEDNTFTDGTVEMRLSGDANGDRTVNYKDLFLLAQSYGTVLGDPEYNPDADFNGDNKIDYKDLFKLAQNYGISCS